MKKQTINYKISALIKSLLCKGFCIFLLSVTFPCPAKADTYKIAVEGKLRPLNYLDERGNLTGFDVEIALTLCKEAAIRCTLTQVPKAELIDGLIAKRYDIIASSMNITPEDEQLVSFTRSYYRSHSAFVAKSGSYPAYIKPETFENIRISAATSTVQGAYLTQKFSLKNNVRLTRNPEEAFSYLLSGKTDVILCEALNCFSFLTSEKGKDYDFIGGAVKELSHVSSVGIAVRKDDRALLTALNEALQTIFLNGTYDKINRKYLPFSLFAFLEAK